MPKALPTAFHCLFAVIKPSGPASMTVVNTIKPLLSTSRLFLSQEDREVTKERVKGMRKRKGRRRNMVKMGTGGTLDPLADGVLVLGVGDGTKQLATYLDCVKEYKTTGLLGCETDSYDSEGARVRLAPWLHVTRQTLEDSLDRFRGEILQTPPIFSALKMDGKPLYDYARKGRPLPRPIPPRKVTVYSLEVLDWIEGNAHTFEWPQKALSLSDKENMKKALENPIFGEEQEDSIHDDPGLETNDAMARPPVFVLRMRVSGGTYVRSLVHDIGHAVGSAAHVATLTRLRQGNFTMEPVDERDVGCIPWELFQEAAEEDEGPQERVDRDDTGLRRWESEVLKKLVTYKKPDMRSAVQVTSEVIS